MVYAEEIADALEAELQPFAATGVIKRISKYDTNPAENPQPPQRFRERGELIREGELITASSPLATAARSS